MPPLAKCGVPVSIQLAERVGFEPTVRLHVRRISSAVLSTTQPPLPTRLNFYALAFRSREGGIPNWTAAVAQDVYG